MKIKKDHSKDKSNVLKSDELPWEEIQQLISGKYLEKYNSVDTTIFDFASKKVNREKVVQAALKTLENREPKSATREKAEALADMMQIFARMVLREIKKEKTI